MNTKTLVASGLAAAMIGGSLVGANALLTDAGASQSTEVQIVQAEPGPEPTTVATDPPAGDPPTNLAVTSPPAGMRAAAPTDGLQPVEPAEQGDEADHDEDNDDDEDQEHEDEDGYGD